MSEPRNVTIRKHDRDRKMKSYNLSSDPEFTVYPQRFSFRVRWRLEDWYLRTLDERISLRGGLLKPWQ